MPINWPEAVTLTRLCLAAAQPTLNDHILAHQSKWCKAPCCMAISLISRFSFQRSCPKRPSGKLTSPHPFLLHIGRLRCLQMTDYQTATSTTSCPPELHLSAG